MSTSTLPLVAPRGGGYLRGCLLVLLSGLVLSMGVFCIRNATGADALQYLFWRAVGFTVALFIVASVRDHRNPIRQVATLGSFGLAAAIAIAISQVSFIAAIKVSTFAEVFFLISLAPLLSAVLALPLLGERIGWIGAIAIALGLAGVHVMIGGSIDTGGEWLGRSLALTSALSFAIYTIATRGSNPEDLDATLILVGLMIIGGVGAALMVMGRPIVPSVVDAAIAMFHGAFILSAGLWLIGQGSRLIPGVTLTMLAQAESVLSPIWGFLFFDESPAVTVILGGAIILASVVLQAVDGARTSNRTR